MSKQYTDIEDLRTLIQNELDRDGQLDWDETSRLADLLTGAIWNELTTFPLRNEVLLAELRAKVEAMWPARGEVPHHWQVASGEMLFARRQVLALLAEPLGNSKP